ncbi:MAG: hypothetical protein IPH69_16645 [Bacteroidales bacterium]|nr:hypothetical protein [Bacteroidales bacterium]
MKNKIYTILVMSILLSGCVKTSGKLEIKGTVTDESTRSPIPGRSVIVQGLVLNNNKLVPVDAGEFSTDSSGSFAYSLNKIKDAYHYNFCLVGDSDYSYTTEELALPYLHRNAKYLAFSLNKLSDLTILIFRKSIAPPVDTLFLSWRTDGIDGRTLYPYKIINNGLNSSSELRWIGGNVKATVKTRAYADKMTIVRWVLFRNGRGKEIIDTITCKRDLVNEVHLIY